MKKFELSIPKPCHENWNAMTPEDKGRFCGACQKTVIDFTDMSDRQIAEFFKKPEGNVCGRFGGDQLNRVIEVPRKRIPWIKHFFTIALPAFLFSMKVGAQGQVRVKGKVAVCDKPVEKPDTINPVSITKAFDGRLGMVLPIPVQPSKPDSLQTIRGMVVDESGQPIAGATLMLRGIEKATTTNAQGEFTIKQPNANYTELLVSSVGYESQLVTIKNQKNVYITLSYHVMGEVVTVGAVVKKKPKAIPLINPIQKDSALSKFSVYPNPVERNAVFTIETKDMEDGRYNMSVITSTGEVVQTKELTIENKAKRIRVQLENISAAPYFIRLTNKANNKAYTEIILVK